jgi:hypothetical protein
MTTHARLPFPAPVPRPERLTRLSGVAAAGLFLAVDAIAPNPPMHGGTDAAVLAHFRAHHADSMRGAFVAMLGLAALLVFTAAVLRGAARARRRIGAEPGVAAVLTPLVAAVTVGLLMVSQAGAAATANVGQHTTDVGLLRAMDDIGHMAAHLAVFPFGLFTLATGLALREARFGARWVASLGAGVGTAMLLSGLWVAVGGQTVHNLGALTWLATFLWLAAQSVALGLADRAPRGRVAPASIGVPVAA